VTLGGGGGYETVSQNDTRGREGACFLRLLEDFLEKLKCHVKRGKGPRVVYGAMSQNDTWGSKISQKVSRII
jgi:hypothetical protein